MDLARIAVSFTVDSFETSKLPSFEKVFTLILVYASILFR